METLADLDDHLMELYLGGQEIPLADLLAVIRRGTIDLKIVPIYCGAALRNKGVQPLLDGIIHFLPNPMDIPPVSGRNPISKKMETRPASDEAPFPAWPLKSLWTRGEN